MRAHAARLFAISFTAYLCLTASANAGDVKSGDVQAAFSNYINDNPPSDMILSARPALTGFSCGENTASGSAYAYDCEIKYEYMDGMSVFPNKKTLSAVLTNEGGQWELRP